MTKHWTSFALQAELHTAISNGNYRQAFELNPPTPGATLLRTMMTGWMMVQVPTAGVAPPSNWWDGSYTEMRAVWSPDGSLPAPVINTRLPGDLGRIVLEPTPYADPGGAPQYHVKFSSTTKLDSEGQRKPASADTPAVWFYYYHFDLDHALNGSYNPAIFVSLVGDALWSA